MFRQGMAVCNVLGNGTGENHCVLCHQADLSSQSVRRGGVGCGSGGPAWGAVQGRDEACAPETPRPIDG